MSIVIGEEIALAASAPAPSAGEGPSTVAGPLPPPADRGREAVPLERSEHPIRESIKREVRAIVLARRGAARAVTGEELVALVSARLDLEGWLASKTILRRCQEAVAQLVADGEPIASTSRDGYFVAETAEEIEAGRRDLGHRLGSLARRFRAFDRNTADRILALLGQAGLDLGEDQAA